MNQHKEALQSHLLKSQPQQQQNKETQSPLQQQQNNLLTNPYNQQTPNIGEKLEAAKWRKTKDPSTGRKYWYHKETKQTTWDIPSAILRVSVSVQNVVDWNKESQAYHKYNALLINLSKQITNKSHIKLIHIYLVESFVNNNVSFTPKDILDIILFYYAKPLIMRLKKDKEATTKFVLYCPIIDTYNSMMNKIKNKFAIKSDFQLYYGDISTSSGIRMDLEDWIYLKWNTDDLFCVDTLFIKDWIMTYEATPGRLCYLNLKTAQTRWDAPPGFNAILD